MSSRRKKIRVLTGQINRLADRFKEIEKKMQRLRWFDIFIAEAHKQKKRK
jgi:hypothetical protein